MSKQANEMTAERQHLADCLDVICDNISMYEQKEHDYQQEVTSLFQDVRKGDGDSYGQLLAGQSILESTRNSLRKNRAALEKAYFGRIDYHDKTYGLTESCYIGKNEVTRNLTEVVIVDWRAPVTSVYYENELGDGSYDVPGSTPIEICLNKKRTYDIDKTQLLGYYDDDSAANDDLLVKYLAQHKEAVLGDIIATIQKEQNQIIRDIPFKNIIVQGVAGSGKTTVALHRISYILYNYADRYTPSEFCIVGSSDMLLNYISSGLPELDVNHVRQMRMDLFIPYLMGKAWKKKFQLIPDRPDANIRSKLPFILKLEEFLAQWEEKHLALADINDKDLGRTVFTEDNMREIRRLNPQLSQLQFEKLLNERLNARIKFLCSDYEPDPRKAKVAQYRKYFNSDRFKWTETQIYLEFLDWLEQKDTQEQNVQTQNLQQQNAQAHNTGLCTDKNELLSGHYDIYDAAALALIYRRILMKKDVDEFSQIIIDEAQDFGEMIYYVLKQLLPDCFFTIMGDVSQNIRYETGMNDWDGLKKAIFDNDNDSFCLLSKSYRNTIEISQCAGKVLEKASQGSYKIQPVIRHGQEVTTIQTDRTSLEQKLKETIHTIKKKDFETIAIVCRTDEEAAQVRQILNIQSDDIDQFHNGVMVLPVTLTKGLEFDAVVLWKPDDRHYGMNRKEAKLLYVAITRALHELYMIGDEPMSGLLA